MIVYEVSAFTRNNNGGNLAGVVILEDVIEEKVMQETAFKLGYSETAFVEILNDNHYHIRYFTPNQEVALCGHATIASFHILNKLKYLTNNNPILHTKDEVIKIKIEESIFMEMPHPELMETISKEVVAILLNIDKKDIVNVPQIVKVGLADGMVVVKDINVLNNIKVNKEAMIKVSNDYNITGFHVATIDEGRFIVRNFAPAYAIDEESATGTSNASMYAYLESKGYLNGNEEVTFYQGDIMKLPSSIIVSCTEEILFVGGEASVIKELEV
jgi:PhzF family phenazine biosynthesis protein